MDSVKSYDFKKACIEYENALRELAKLPVLDTKGNIVEIVFPIKPVKPKII